MTTKTNRPGAPRFEALELALEIIVSLREVVAAVRRHDARLANQIVAAASSIAANLSEGNRRVGRDRLHLFRIAAGSADETRTHLRVALAWGFVRGPASRAGDGTDRSRARDLGP
jgi:four helix bundle protein